MIGTNNKIIITTTLTIWSVLLLSLQLTHSTTTTNTITPHPQHQHQLQLQRQQRRTPMTSNNPHPPLAFGTPNPRRKFLREAIASAEVAGTLAGGAAVWEAATGAAGASVGGGGNVA